VLQEPAHILDSTAVVIQELDLSNDAAFADLEYTHCGILEPSAVIAARHDGYRSTTTRRCPDKG
jgi:hypothetical protein